MSEHTLDYLDPTVRKPDGTLHVPAVGALEGRTVAFLNNGWSSFGKIGARMQSVLHDKYRIKEMKTYLIPSAAPPQTGLLEQVAQECDVAIVGMAN